LPPFILDFAWPIFIEFNEMKMARNTMNNDGLIFYRLKCCVVSFLMMLYIHKWLNHTMTQYSKKMTKNKLLYRMLWSGVVCGLSEIGERKGQKIWILWVTYIFLLITSHQSQQW
jgi:hypothetical protein